MVLYKETGGAEVTCIGSGVQMRLQSGVKEWHAAAPPSFRARPIGIDPAADFITTGTGHEHFNAAIIFHVSRSLNIISSMSLEG